MHATPGRLMLTAGGFGPDHRSVPFADVSCPLELRAYRTGARSGAPAWDSERLRRGGCPFDAPHGPQPSSLHFEIPVSRILGDSLPDGEYHLATALRFPGETLEFPGRSAFLTRDTLPPVSDISGLRYRVETRVEPGSPRELRTVVTVTNSGPRRVSLEFGACTLLLRAYRTPARTGRPVWYSERARPRWAGKDDFGYACPMYLAHRVLAPGESVSPKEFQARVPVPEILGDSLPEGRYSFTAQLGFAGANRADTVRLPAGEADLTPRPDPLPREARLDDLAYRAEVRDPGAAADSLEVVVRVRNTGTATAVARMALDVECGIAVYGYRSARERDAWYLLREAPWTGRGCAVRVPPLRLAPGESRELRGRLARAGWRGMPRGGVYYMTTLWVADAEGETHRLIVAGGEPETGPE